MTVTTKLEEVLAEKWRTNGLALGCVFAGDVTVGEFVRSPDRLDRLDPTRASVAVLGKRALALVLNHEWSGADTIVGESVCADCGEPAVRSKHASDCEWGAICDEARRLG
jgi:hypothetical protein